MKRLIVILLVIAAAAGGYYFGVLRGARMVVVSGGQSKLEHTLELIEQEYVDPVDMDSLAEQVIPLVVEQLDPHSVYIPAQEMAVANEQIEGEFDGIGVVFNMATDTILVLNVVPGGPSDKAGVRNGDKIIRIDDSLVAGRQIPQMEIVRTLRGMRGTKVKLGIERKSVWGLLEITVEGGVIPVKSIDAAFMLEPGVGFIRLRTFTMRSHEELVEALEKLNKEGMERLVLDLRGNGGGPLDQVIAIANELLPRGQMIVYTLDRDGQKFTQLSRGGRYTTLPIAVLIDEWSASASEILAGAIQDNDRGRVVGRRSFGKGLVQRQIDYSDGSALRLTIARYYTPTGRSVQKPYDQGAQAYADDLLNRYKHHEFFSADSIHFADSLRFTTPAGRTVYGGGGIMPDLFIPLDTLDMTPYYYDPLGMEDPSKFPVDAVIKQAVRVVKVRT